MSSNKYTLETERGVNGASDIFYSAILDHQYVCAEKLVFGMRKYMSIENMDSRILNYIFKCTSVNEGDFYDFPTEELYCLSFQLVATQSFRKTYEITYWTSPIIQAEPFPMQKGLTTPVIANLF